MVMNISISSKIHLFQPYYNFSVLMTYVMWPLSDGLPNRGPKMAADARLIRDRRISVIPVGDSVT